jgi:hypothetical protein
MTTDRGCGAPNMVWTLAVIAAVVLVLAVLIVRLVS